MSTTCVVQLGKRREEGGVRTEVSVSVSGARGQARGGTVRVLYLFIRNDATGMPRAAVHGPSATYTDQVAMATPVFGSAAENILTEGAHEWQWLPCMLRF